MLSATLYRYRKALAKKPWVILLALLFVGMGFLFLFSGIAANDSEDTVRNLELSVGAINIIYILIFNFLFFSGLKNGAVGFTHADVNFHLAGPFTPRFNLIIASTGIAQMCGMFLWVLCAQCATLSLVFGFNGADLIALLLGSVVVMLISYSLGSFLCAFFNENEKMIEIIRKGTIALDVLFVAANYVILQHRYGSFSQIKSLGFKGLITAIGSSPLARFFPIAGWTNLFYTGIVYKETVYCVLGVIIVIALFIAIISLYLNTDLDYYESAMAYAQKVADLKEAKRAGIDTDTSKLNAKVKVGKETMTKGWGASAFTYRHFLENARGTRFFFINSLAVTYRLITFVYAILMQQMSSMADMSPIISISLMMIILNSMVYGGGKTILEFNRPYIFMVPEKASRKLFACLGASLPEMTFDAILCGVIMMVGAHLSIAEGAVTALMMLAFNFLFQLLGLISLRIFQSLGRVLLMTLRSFLSMGVVLFCFIPAIFTCIAAGGFGLIPLFLGGTIGAVIISAICMLFAKDLVDKVELA